MREFRLEEIKKGLGCDADGFIGAWVAGGICGCVGAIGGNLVVRKAVFPLLDDCHPLVDELFPPLFVPKPDI